MSNKINFCEKFKMLETFLKFGVMDINDKKVIKVLFLI
jgi:hypothetical protein